MTRQFAFIILLCIDVLWNFSNVQGVDCVVILTVDKYTGSFCVVQYIITQLFN